MVDRALATALEAILLASKDNEPLMQMIRWCCNDRKHFNYIDGACPGNKCESYSKMNGKVLEKNLVAFGQLRNFQTIWDAMEQKKASALSIDEVGQFLYHWDYGGYKTGDNKHVLEALLQKFPYQGTAYRGTGDLKTKPPLSWAKTLKAVVSFWQVCGVGRQPMAIYKSATHGIDLTAVCKWYLSQPDRDTKIDFRAKRLASFREVLTLDKPTQMTLVGHVNQVSINNVEFEPVHATEDSNAF